MSYGVTTTGFVKKDLDTIKAEVESALRSRLGETINLLPTSVLGQLVGIITEREASLWDQAEAIYNAAYPLTSAGQALDSLASLTGVTRLAATKSTVTLSCNLDPSTTLDAGRIVSQGEGSTVRFTTIEAATNSGVSAADVDVLAEAEATGPVAATAGTLTRIETPVSGWNSVTNALDADPGRNRETDAELRARRQSLLRMTGAGAVDAIRADVLDVPGVTAALVFNNPTDATDADGVPPHALEVLARGGEEQAILEAIWQSAPAGIAAHGDITGTVTDSQGFAQPVAFSRPVEVDVYVAVTLVTSRALTLDDEAAIKLAIATAGDAAAAIGRDVYTGAMEAAAYAYGSVLGVEVLVGLTAGTATEDSLTLDSRELAVFDSSRIALTWTAA